MKDIKLSPLDIYQVINKSILNETDKLVLTMLYMPIIGNNSITLYLTLYSELSLNNYITRELSHHHLISTTGLGIKELTEARMKLEGIGLMKTYIKEDDINSYIYELYSPISPNEFFNHPIFNMVLFNNIGKEEYNRLINYFKVPKIDFKNYTDITSPFDMCFKSECFTPLEIEENIIKKETLKLNYELDFDFDIIIKSIPKSIFNSRCLNKSMKELIINLGFLYELDPLTMADLIKTALNEKGCIEKDTLRKNVRKYYQFNNSNRLPSLIFKSQPEYLKSNKTDNTNRTRLIRVFENTSPYQFLRAKYKGARPTDRDMSILENLLVDLKLNPAVVNVLIDYVLKTNNNKLVKAYVDTIAGQWKRSGVETASEAMDFAEKEHKKKSKSKKTIEKIPVWFNKEIEKEEVSEEEKKELEELLKEFK